MLATVTVTNLTDVEDGATSSISALLANPGADGGISLREAISAANATSGGDAIRFSPSLFNGGPKSIVLKNELFIDTALTIDGPGSNLLTLDAAGADPTPNNGVGSRIFRIQRTILVFPISVALSGMTLTGGDVGSTNLDGSGGAIWNNQNLTLSHVVVANNSASFRGGGVHHESSQTGFTTKLTVIDSSIIGNKGGQFGGGLVIGGAGDIIRSDVRLNSVSEDGGGIILVTNFAANSKYSIVDSLIVDNTARRGGGILGNQGPLTISGSTIRMNKANGSSGGGIWQLFGTLNISDSAIVDNTSTVSGGGIYQSGLSSIVNTEISRNTSTGGVGGGIDNRGDMDLSNCVVSLNLATLVVAPNTGIGIGMGAGISNGGTLDITASTVSNNTARLTSTGIIGVDIGGGGGIYNKGDQFGGTSPSVLNVRDSTISSNRVEVQALGFEANEGFGGGGIASLGVMSLTNSTVSDNKSLTGNGGGVLDQGSATITGSTIADNFSVLNGGGLSAISLFGSASSIESLTNTLVTNNAALLHSNLEGGFNGGFNYIGDLPLGPLQDNGGPTLTHALPPGSPAINAGDPSIIAIPGQYDQRGAPYARVVGGRRDIGAIESQPLPVYADFNANGRIEGFDFLAWQRGFGAVGAAATRTNGNADNDGDVDATDLARWKSTFGNPVATATVEQAVAASVVSDSSTLHPQVVDAALAWQMASEAATTRPFFRPRLARVR